MTFNELNLSAPLLRAIAEAGYETPSPIQAKAIPALLAGKDVLGSAKFRFLPSFTLGRVPARRWHSSFP